MLGGNLTEKKIQQKMNSKTTGNMPTLRKIKRIENELYRSKTKLRPK
jgi:hypothetical protein